jgi:uncharacterized protein (TIGR03089 family)
VPAADPDVPSLLRRLLLADSGRPRLTWYGPDSERVELSARVLDNWVAKSANLLVDELDAGPGSRVGVDLPGHWRTAAWLLAIWSAGACAVVGDQPEADVRLTTDPAGRPGRPAAGGQVVAVALPALALSFGPGLPPGAIDAAVEVRTQGDVFVPPARPAPADPALVHPDGGTVTHGDLLGAARDSAARAGWAPGARVLSTGTPAEALHWLLAPLTLGGSVVLHGRAGGPDGPALDRIAVQEQVTDRLG